MFLFNRILNPIRTTLFLIISFLPFICFAQSLDTDSLRSVLPQSKGNDRLFILNELAFNLREIAQQEALDYSIEAEQLAIHLTNKSEEAKAKENLSWIYYRKGKWQKTFDYSNEAFKLATEAGDMKAAARVLNSMGALYFEQENYSVAIKQFKRAYQLSSGENDLYTSIRSLNNVSYCFLMSGKLDSAVYYANKSLDVNFASGLIYVITFPKRIKGDVFLQLNQLDSAEYQFEQSLAVAEANNLINFKSSLLHRLGNVYLQQGKFELSQQALLEGIKIAKVNEWRDDLSKSHLYLAKYYEKMGNFELAYREQLEFSQLNDSLTNKSTRDRIALMQGMFQDNLNRTELDLLKAQNDNQASRLSSVRRIIIVIGLGSFLILVLLVWLFYLNRNIKKANRDLLQQQQQINIQNRDLKATSHQLIEINQTKNKLFSILGHDLRGPIGQVKTISDLIVEDDLDEEEFKMLIKILKKDVDSVYFTLGNTLRWSVTQMEGFKLAPTQFNLSELIAVNLELNNPQIKNKSIEIRNSIPSNLTVTTDRDLLDVIIRNILSNAVKFSESGSLIDLSLQENSHSFILAVTDYGAGISAEQIQSILSDKYIITDSKPGTEMEKGSGLGLQICKEFARLNGGDLVIESTIGVGTTVKVKIPLHQST